MTSASGLPLGALDGLRVIELGTLIAGPFAGHLMADMGADVIKVEDPDRPDPLRDWGQAADNGHYLLWTVYSRNKRCITLNLRSPEGQELLRQLIDGADVLIESFRPGTLERWGLGYDVLSARNPRLILARVSGYGQTGPASKSAGYASVAEGVSGFRFLNGYPGQAPPRTALSLGDSLAGMFTYQGILAALLAREKTQRGQVVDTALSEACLALLESTVPDYDRTGHIRQPSGTKLDGIAPSNIYVSSDGLWVIVAANQDTVYRRLCVAIGQPELADDPRFATHIKRGENQDELDAIIAEWAAKHTAEQILSILSNAGVVAGPINTVAEVVKNPQFIARGIFVDHPDEAVGMVKGVGVVPQLSETPGGLRWSGPRSPGSHNSEIFEDLLQLSPEKISALIEQGVI